jgi:hypothetical protein
LWSKKNAGLALSFFTTLRMTVKDTQRANG